MKTTVNLAGTQNRSFCAKPLVCIALVVVFGFAMMACGEKPGGGPTLYKVTFNANGGTLEGETTKIIEVESGKTVTPPTPTNTDSSMIFWGWYPQNSGSTRGNEFTASTPVTADRTVYAWWSTTTKPTTYTVTFNANGGTFAGGSTTSPVTVFSGETVNPLPTATRSGYDFTSWNSNSNGSGTAFTTSTTVSANTTVYAQWTQQIVVGPGGNGSFTSISGKDVYLDESYYDSVNDVWVTKFTKVTGNSYDGSYAYEWDWNNDTIAPLSTYLNTPTTVQITTGKLTINLGTPKSEVLESVVWVEEEYGSLTISNRNAKMFMLDVFCSQNGEVSLDYIGENNDIFLVYVDNNVTISGSGSETYSDKGGSYEERWTFALNLRTGWNYVKTSWYETNDIEYFSWETTQPGNDSMWIVGAGYGAPDLPGGGGSGDGGPSGSVSRLSENITAPPAVRGSLLKRSVRR